MKTPYDVRRRWKTKNVFLIGYAGAGKTTVARMMTKRYYEPFALAQPIKNELGRWLRRPATKGDRALMIDFGQTFRRWFGDGVWCDTLDKDECFRDYSSCGRAVIDDGRHLVEYRYFVEERGFVPVRIVAPDEVRFERLLKRDGVDQRWVDAHERELDDVDVAYTIVNDGTLDELEAKVEAMLATINEEGTK